MKRLLGNDVTKVLAFLVLGYLLAAALVPHLYNFGQFLGDVTAENAINPLVDHLGREAREADYGRYFTRALFLAAFLLVPILLPFLGNNNTPPRRPGPWSFALPPRAIATRRGQALEASAGYYWELLSGFILAATLLIATGVFALSLGYFTWEKAFSLPATVPPAFALAMASALVQEILFRGILLGIFLRFFRPAFAIAAVAFLFAALHYLRPPADIMPTQPESLGAGFTFLGLILTRLFDSAGLLQEFLFLFLAGIILGACRYRTVSLWLPIGLHAGWIFALRIFENLSPTNREGQELDALVGARLSEGLLPIGALLLTALVIWLIYREPDTHRGEMNDDLNLPHPSPS